MPPPQLAREYREILQAKGAEGKKGEASEESAEMDEDLESEPSASSVKTAKLREIRQLLADTGEDDILKLIDSKLPEEIPSPKSSPGAVRRKYTQAANFA
eukprot:11881213-Alexandrium_andersonii.AAC.1